MLISHTLKEYLNREHVHYEVLPHPEAFHAVAIAQTLHTRGESDGRGLAQGTGLSAIARQLGRAPSTVAREVQHNSGKSGYRAFSAGNRAHVRASSRHQGKGRLTRDDRLRRYVMEKLRKRWSPREIVNRLPEEYPEDRTMRLSHETIYRYIYVLPRGALKTTLIQALRQARAYRRKRKPRHHQETRGNIVEMLSIDERPQAVADRTVPGHWEGDHNGLIGREHRATGPLSSIAPVGYGQCLGSIKGLTVGKKRQRVLFSP